MHQTLSKNKVPIRLTFERWYHITENHDDLASYFHEVLETVENPEIIVAIKVLLKQLVIMVE